MRWALISDIHGNLEALDAVLRDIATQHVNEIFCQNNSRHRVAVLAIALATVRTQRVSMRNFICPSSSPVYGLCGQGQLTASSANRGMMCQ